MTHLKPINRKAARVERATEPDVVALQRTGLPLLPHFPIGCSLVFSPGWEADRAGGTAGPGQRQFFGRLRVARMEATRLAPRCWMRRETCM